MALVVILAALGAASARAQARPSQLIATARAMMDSLQSDSAATLLQLALRSDANATPAEQVRAWTLFGINELVRENVELARQSFRRALSIDPTLQVDSLAELHTSVLREFGAERGALGPVRAAPMTVQVQLAGDTVVPVTDGRLVYAVRPARRARVIATVTAGDSSGAIVRADTATVTGDIVLGWDLRNRAGALVTPGRFTLRLVASDTTGENAARRDYALTLQRARVDTTALPSAQPPQSAFVPETVQVRGSSPAVLLRGVVFAAAAVGLPMVLGNPELRASLGTDAKSFIAAGAVSLAGLYGFLSGTRWKSDPELQRRNQATRDRAALARTNAIAANAELRARAPMIVRAQAVGP
jgi:hypothetical protein